MNMKSLIGELREIVQQMRDDGRTEVPIANLLEYLEAVEAEPTSPEELAAIERYKAELQGWNDDKRRQHELYLEGFRSTITAGQSAIRTIVLANGGAAVAILAFIGHLATSNPGKVALLVPSLVPFTSGVLMGGLVSGGTYLSQLLFSSANDKHRVAATAINLVVIVLGLLAFILFAAGMHDTYFALLRLGSDS